MGQCHIFKIDKISIQYCQTVMTLIHYFVTQTSFETESTAVRLDKVSVYWVTRYNSSSLWK